ncbi:MAG TPA: hypothetical protein VLM40_16670 [Gemmata sp.]|nr:hypothetical protein [Gemmata sp.]
MSRSAELDGKKSMQIGAAAIRPRATHGLDQGCVLADADNEPPPAADPFEKRGSFHPVTCRARLAEQLADELGVAGVQDDEIGGIVA